MCEQFNKLQTLNQGFGIFKMEKLLICLDCIGCDGVFCEVRNIGFVNCEWGVKGYILDESGSPVRVLSEGKTYDNKLHLFKEVNYNEKLCNLLMIVQKREIINDQNLPSDYKSSLSALTPSDAYSKGSSKN